MSKLFATVASLSLLVSAIAYSPEALADEVLNLPGAESLSLNFRHFSGYIPVGSKNLHYWMVESMSNPETDPISFWTNGAILNYSFFDFFVFTLRKFVVKLL